MRIGVGTHKMRNYWPNRGTVNRFNIGITGSDRVSFYRLCAMYLDIWGPKYIKCLIEDLESILPPKVSGENARVSKDIKSTFSEGRSGAFFSLHLIINILSKHWLKRKLNY